MFLNVIMLAGIAGAGVPLLLHLLSRRCCPRVEWGAMMFLHTADAKQRRSTRLKQWLLLAVRMALVSLLAVAPARPVAAGRWGSFGQQGAMTAVILLDHSAAWPSGRRAMLAEMKPKPTFCKFCPACITATKRCW